MKEIVIYNSDLVVIVARCVIHNYSRNSDITDE